MIFGKKAFLLCEIVLIEIIPMLSRFEQETYNVTYIYAQLVFVTLGGSLDHV